MRERVNSRRGLESGSIHNINSDAALGLNIVRCA